MGVGGSIGPIIKRANEIKVDSVYSQKAHDNFAAYLERLATWEAILAVVLSAGASGSLILSLGFGPGPIAIVVAIAGVVGVVYHTTKPAARAARHRIHALRLLEVSKSVRTFANVDCVREGMTYEEARKNLSGFEDTYGRASAAASHDGVPDWAYQMAREGIARGEATYTDDELRM